MKLDTFAVGRCFMRLFENGSDGDGNIWELIRQMRESLDEIAEERIRVMELAVYGGELDE